MMKELLKRIEKLEKQVKLLTESRLAPHGQRSKQYANWLMDLFEDETDLDIRWIRKQAKKRDFSWQMLLKAKRELLEDKIGTYKRKGDGEWVWRKL